MAKIVSTKNFSKKEVIVKKAAVLFRKKGFAGTSMRELAESIGVEASSLYNHIGSKGELLQMICFKTANDFNIHLSDVEKKTTHTVHKLENIIRFHINMMQEHFDEVYVANHEWKQLEDPFLSNFLQQRKSYEIRLIDLVNLGIKKKELRPIDPSVAVLTMLSAVRGLEFWNRHKKNNDGKTLENNMVDHLLNGLIK